VSPVLETLDAAFPVLHRSHQHLGRQDLRLGIILLLTGVVSYEVFMRYVLRHPRAWAYDTGTSSTARCS
jgi:hypothetical protein